MSLNLTIQDIEDTQLIQIFLQFTHSFNLNYQKNSTEISYKCFQATWIVKDIRATGYGRTETQAYKHALRNLFDLIIEREHYQRYFQRILHGKSQTQQEDKQNISYEESFSFQHPNHKIINLDCPKPTNNNYEFRDKNNQKNKQFLNRNIGQIQQSNIKQQLKQAENRYNYLLENLNNIREQNNNLKQKLKFEQAEKIKAHNRLQSSHKEAKLQKTGSKIAIPKLRLQILPNYHKKSQKSLNQSLLATYNKNYTNSNS